jgi:hypothetical protein
VTLSSRSGLRAIAFIALPEACAPGSCGRGTPPINDAAPPVSTANALLDAAGSTSTYRDSRLRPVAISTSGSRLHRLTDGALLFSHGFAIDRLDDIGRRSPFTTIRVAPDFETQEVPIGTAVGTQDDLWVSIVEYHYPAGASSRSSRLLGSAHDAKPALGKDVFYRSIVRWDRDRRLALRANGAMRWVLDMLPYVPDRFVVVAGSPTTAPTIPPKTFIEDFTAFPSGTVLAVASTWEEAAIGRHDGNVLRWKPGVTKPDVEVLPSHEGDSADLLAARAEDDVWVGGSSGGETPKPGWFAHFDGTQWTREEAPFKGGPLSMSIAEDGSLWTISNGLLLEETKTDGAVDLPPNLLYRREPFGKGAMWTPVELDGRGSSTVPRLKYANNAVILDRSPTWQMDIEPLQVVARGREDVWVVARTRLRDGGLASMLFHTEATRPNITDLDEEESRTRDDRTRPPTKDCASLFVGAGEPTPDAIHRIRGAASTLSSVVVIARMDGKRVVGSYIGRSEESADEVAMTWRKLGLPAFVRCGTPALEELVFAPDERDD